jgi:hypothetical protein
MDVGWLYYHEEGTSPRMATDCILMLSIARFELHFGCKSKVEDVRFEVFTAVSVKNVVFWDIKPKLYLTENTLHLRYGPQPVNAMYDLRFLQR